MKKLMAYLIIFLITICLGGCWDIRDISNRAFVTAIGLDVPEDPEQKYKVTFEFFDPYKSRQEQIQSVALVETVEAKSIGQAIEQMQGRISSTITFTHLRLLLVGEELAKAENFLDLANFFEKYAEIALRLRLGFVEDGLAQDILQSNPKLSSSPSSEIIKMVQLERDFSLSRTNKFYSFLNDLRSSQGTAFGSRIIRSDAGFIIRNGGTVFDRWKAKGFLNSQETQNANWLIGMNPEVTVFAETNDGSYTYRVHRKSLKIVPIVDNNQLSFLVKFKTQGHIIEEAGKHLNLTKEENIDKLEKLFSQVITQEVESAINKSQKNFRIDYLGFGQVLKQKKPQIYEQMNWYEEFSEIPISVEVTAQIDRFGLVK